MIYKVQVVSALVMLLPENVELVASEREAKPGQPSSQSRPCKRARSMCTALRGPTRGPGGKGCHVSVHRDLGEFRLEGMV